MKRNLLRSIACGITLGLGVAAAAHADEFPSKPITLLIPVAPGGTTDIAGRALARQLRDKLGQSVIVDNKPGASGSIANSAVSRAQPDGYTLVLSYEGFHAGNPAIRRNLPWDPVKSFTPIAEVIRGPHLILVPASSPARSLRDFLEHARKSPGRLSFASAGIGSIQHFGAELLQLKTDTKMVHVPYSGAAPAMQDLLGSRIDLFITTPPTAMAHVEAGTVRALAITSAKRHPNLPNVPTTAEAGLPDFTLDAWFSIFGPAGMPKPVVSRLAKAIEEVVTSTEFRREMEAQGTNASFRAPDEVATMLRDDLKKWADLVKAAQINVD